MSTVIIPLASQHRSEWEALTREYNAFYKADKSSEDYAHAWTRLTSDPSVHGLVASSDGRLTGLAHFLFHKSTWAPAVCYLQDLYTSPENRNKGIASALIAAVAEVARSEGATRFYWLTRESNVPARALYDKVARYNGFIRYEYPLATEA